MADKPMIFSAPMVQALLDGRKTQTRRVLGKRGQNNIFSPGQWSDEYVLDEGNAEWRARDTPYATGDRIYVREAFLPRLGYPKPMMMPRYRADDDRPEWRHLWKPSIHMPRWASRLTLTVTDVRVQRLCDISEADAVSEGITPYDPCGNADDDTPAADAFMDLWDDLHGQDSPKGWNANPWVVALTFTVQPGNIDDQEA